MRGTDVVITARQFLGAEFLHQGRRTEAMDCIGLLVLTAKACGFALQDIHVYTRDPDGVSLLRHLREQMAEVEVASAQEGDVLVFWITNASLPAHVGLKTDSGILHTYADVNRVVEHGLSQAWKRRIVAAFRFRELL